LSAFVIADIIEKIATILILEHASLHFASPFTPTKDEALNQAYTQYCASDIRFEVRKQFSVLPMEYSKVTQFILDRRLRH
jgi:hypothetical protein